MTAADAAIICGTVLTAGAAILAAGKILATVGRFDGVADDVSDLKTAKAVTDTKIEGIEARVSGLEERERDRP